STRCCWVRRGALATDAESARLLTWLQEVGVPVNDPPPPLLTTEQVRHPQRRLTDLGGVIEPPSAALDVDRVRDGLVHAFKQVLAVKPALGVAGSGPLKARLDRCPALFVGAPAAEDGHIVRAGPQALVRLGVALGKPPQGVQELLGEFVPVRHASLLACPSMPARSGRRNDHLIRRSRQVVQDRLSPVVGWADIPELSTCVGCCPAAWLQSWLQSRR